jgi:hypothetical protein
MALYSAGPSGGPGGGLFQDGADETLTFGGKYRRRIASILIRHGSWIDSIQLTWFTLNDDLTGTLEASRTHGGFGGGASKFELNLDAGDYITGISGTYKDYVNTISITTHLKGSGYYIYGSNQGPRGFHYSALEGYEVCGFQGGSGVYLDSLGVIFRPYLGHF